MTDSATPGVQTHRRLIQWLARSSVAIALAAGGAWWSSTANFHGTTYCEEHDLTCDGPGFERLAPYVLWPLTVITSLFVCVAASLTAPPQSRARAVWGAMIGTSVFLANRNTIVWAVIAAGSGAWLVASGDR